MRVPLPLLCVGAALLLGACTRASAQPPTIVAPAAAPPAVPAPAAAAGGACELLDFAVLAGELGIDFDVAAATGSGTTQTCVVQSSAASLPDLVLTVSPTAADAAVFRSEMEPDGAKTVTSLGSAAYRGTVKAAAGRGAAAEVGWLTGDKHLLVVRLTLPAGATKPAAEKHTGGLVRVAKAIDAARA